MKYLSCILLVLFFTGCASNKANRKLKRAERLTEQAIALGADVKNDTVYRWRTVIIDSTRVDSIFTSLPGDTVYLERERLRVKYVRLKGDSVFIQGDCLPDTLKIEVPVIVNNEIKTGLGVLTVVQWSILALLIGAVLSHYMRHRD
jgi:hypothetical protein